MVGDGWYSMVALSDGCATIHVADSQCFGGWLSGHTFILCHVECSQCMSNNLFWSQQPLYLHTRSHSLLLLQSPLTHSIHLLTHLPICSLAMFTHASSRFNWLPTDWLKLTCIYLPSIGFTQPTVFHTKRVKKQFLHILLHISVTSDPTGMLHVCRLIHTAYIMILYPYWTPWFIWLQVTWHGRGTTWRDIGPSGRTRFRRELLNYW